MHYEGQIGGRDCVEASRWYSRAAELGHERAADKLRWLNSSLFKVIACSETEDWI